MCSSKEHNQSQQGCPPDRAAAALLQMTTWSISICRPELNPKAGKLRPSNICSVCVRNTSAVETNERAAIIGTKEVGNQLMKCGSAAALHRSTAAAPLMCGNQIVVFMTIEYMYG